MGRASSAPSRSAADSGKESLDALATAVPEHLWLRPAGVVTGTAAAAAVEHGLARPLAGGDVAFLLVEVMARRQGSGVVTAVAPVAEIERWARACNPEIAARVSGQLALLSASRASWAGLALDRPLVMGIVNVTPDSFSDGGDFVAPERAIAHARALRSAGADILDIGGESTRPGATPVPADEEIRRVEPVVRALAQEGAVVSIDTRSARTMEAALAAGARIINDVSALTADPRSLDVAAASDAAIVLMHMQGEPRTMQANPRYELASLDIVEYLNGRIAACAAAGIERARLIVDPGIGFGKRSEHNLEIMARLGLLHATGCGVLLGISRKSLIGRFNRTESKDRLPGSLAGALQALAQGVQMFRVHDVAETRQAIILWQAIARGA